MGEALRRSSLEAADIDDVVLGEGLYGGGVIARLCRHHPGHGPGPRAWPSTGTAPPGSPPSRWPRPTSAPAWPTPSSPAAPTRPPPPRPACTARWARRTRRAMDAAHPPGDAGRADARHVDHRGVEHRVEAGISREAMDAWALRSHERAIAAIDAGRFTDEIVPMKITTKDGQMVPWEVDEHPRRTSSAEKMAALKVLHPEIPGFSITAGNAAGANDAAAALTISSSSLAEQRGLDAPGHHPVVVVGGCRAGPHRDGAHRGHPGRAGPGRAGHRRRRACSRSMRRSPRSRWPPAAPSASTRTSSMSRGSGCSLGHPVAATGAGCWPPWSTSSAAGAVASAWRRCAPAAGWARPWSSRWPADRRRVEEAFSPEVVGRRRRRGCRRWPRTAGRCRPR